MALIIALVRLLLSLIFAVASVTKLLDQRGTREAITNFGASKFVAPSIAIVLPVLELAIAAGLLFSSTAWWSALGALFTLGVFIVVISANLARGKTHECHCFGQIYSRPLGPSTLLRNLVFALGAVLVLWNGPAQPGIVETIKRAVSQLKATQALLLVVVAAVAVFLIAYLQRRREAQINKAEELPRLPIGSEAPYFELPSYDGGKTSLTHLLAFGKPLLLIFTNPKCGPCISLFKEISDWQTAHNHELTIALLTRGTIKDNFVNVARNSLGQVLLQERHEITKTYGGIYTPSAVMVSSAGRIASDVAVGADEIRELLKSHVQMSGSPYATSEASNPSQEPGIQPSPAVR